MKVREGENPETYGTLGDRIGSKHGEKIVAHLIFDELKLNN